MKYVFYLNVYINEENYMFEVRTSICLSRQKKKYVFGVGYRVLKLLDCYFFLRYGELRRISGNDKRFHCALGCGGAVSRKNSRDLTHQR